MPGYATFRLAACGLFNSFAATARPDPAAPRCVWRLRLIEGIQQTRLGQRTAADTLRHKFDQFSNLIDGRGARSYPTSPMITITRKSDPFVLQKGHYTKVLERAARCMSAAPLMAAARVAAGFTSPTCHQWTLGLHLKVRRTAAPHDGAVDGPPSCRLGFSPSARPIERAKAPAQTDRRSIGSRGRPSRR